MKTRTIKKNKKTSTSFDALKKLYGLTTPEQIKLRIIWQHIQAIVLNVHGNTPENLRKLKVHDMRFRIAEQDRES